VELVIIQVKLDQGLVEDGVKPESKRALNQYDQIGLFIAFWATFKACGNNYFAQIALIIRKFL